MSKDYFASPEAAFHMASIGKDAGLREGYQQGLDQGQQEGYNHGFESGQSTGYNAGWNDAIARSNIQIEKQMEFTRKHVADKEVLAQQLNEQRLLVAQLSARVDLLHTENQGLREVVTALQHSNEELRTEVGLIDEKLQVRTKEYTDSLWQINRCAVFMITVRSVLEDLTSTESPEANGVRALFAKRYAEHVEGALQTGMIEAPLDTDEVFGSSMPQTQKFIRDMLNAAAYNLEHDASENIEPTEQEGPD